MAFAMTILTRKRTPIFDYVTAVAEETIETMLVQNVGLSVNNGHYERRLKIASPEFDQK